MKRKHDIKAFSLVELTVALGVIGFCLLTILGLLAIGINSTRSSTVQTTATNLLTTITSDLEAMPNVTPSFAGPVAKGSVASGSISRSSLSPVYGLAFPAGGNAATANMVIYVNDNGLTNSTAAGALYRVNIWVTASNTNVVASAQPHQETFAHVLITWPAIAPYTQAQGFVEDVVAINRT
jgi:Tfp pilus assembly protein PilV